MGGEPSNIIRFEGWRGFVRLLLAKEWILPLWADVTLEYFVPIPSRFVVFLSRGKALELKGTAYSQFPAHIPLRRISICCWSIICWKQRCRIFFFHRMTCWRILLSGIFLSFRIEKDPLLCKEAHPHQVLLQSRSFLLDLIHTWEFI